MSSTLGENTFLAADYVIVGGGSAGCVLANRLSADPSVTVLLIEAGGDDRPWRDPANFLTKLNIHIPAGFANIYRDPRLSWNYATTPQPAAGGRMIPLPRGRVLGGSSSINGLVYLRGLASDYDHWRQLGCSGWGWQDVAPYFRRSQHFVVQSDAELGRGGPLTIDKAPLRLPFVERVLESLAGLGIPTLATLNGAAEVGATQCEITSRRGVRQSAATAFLNPVRHRPNLRILHSAAVQRIVLEEARAVGVRARVGGTVRFIAARRELILSSGAIGTPHLLHLSGIGPGAMLQRAGIATQVDSVGVGQGLQDHYSAGIRIALRKGPYSINQALQPWRLAPHVLNYLARRRGLLTQGGGHTTAYVASEGGDMPDLQLFSSPLTIDMAATEAAGRTVLDRFPACSLIGYPMRPRSRGEIRTTCANPDIHPDIDPNYLAEPYDQRMTVAALRMNRALAAQSPLAEIVEEELVPGADIESDEALLDHARHRGSTAYHQCGSCAMGSADAPLDPQLRVRGVERLRVVDASVIPSIPSGNINAPILMIAERAPDLILGKQAAVP